MKRISIFIVALVVTASAFAQGVVRTGLYMENGAMVYSDPKSSVTVSVTVKSEKFTPGQFARYAQKLLGVRASLAEREQTTILSAEIYTTPPQTAPVKQISEPTVEVVLPAYRVDNRAQSVEQQAAAAAEHIFSLRRSRKELITGDAGENVFGAGLAAALADMDAQEQQCLTMFYGTTTTSIEEYRYTVTPTAADKNYIVARYRDGVGVVPTSDLSGDPIMVRFTPAKVDTSSLPIVGPKDKANKAEVIVPAECGVDLLCGTVTLDSAQMIIYQYGERVTVVLPVVATK